jgi:hypothetical protein
MAIALPFLSICPRVHKAKGKLIASTAWRFRLLTLGLNLRKVIIDRIDEVVRIRRRYGWIYTRNTKIPFEGIRAVTYGYQDLSLDAYWSWAHDSVDLFSVGLRLHGGKEIHLFNFFGDGTFRNDGPLPDWWYWDDFAFDTSGTQERESRAFVDVLGKILGVPVEAG